MNPTILNTLVAGGISFIIVVSNNCWNGFMSHRKNFQQLKDDASKTQIDFATTLRSELREENRALHDRVIKNENKIMEILSEKITIENNYLTLMEQHSELKIQYAASVSAEEECSRKFSEVQLKYEQLLVEVSKLQGMMESNNEIKI